MLNSINQHFPILRCLLFFNFNDFFNAWTSLNPNINTVGLLLLLHMLRPLTQILKKMYVVWSVTNKFAPSLTNQLKSSQSFNQSESSILYYHNNITHISISIQDHEYLNSLLRHLKSFIDNSTEISLPADLYHKPLHWCVYVIWVVFENRTANIWEKSP